MPRIPEITSRTSARSAGSLRMRANPATFGAEIGEAMQGMGRAIGQAADFLQEREEQDAARWAERSIAEFDTAQTQSRIESMNNAPDGGVGTIDRWSTQFDTQSKSLLDQAPTEKSRQRMETALIRMRGGHVERLMVFEHEARLAATVRDLDATQNAYINQVAMDPSMYASALDNSMAALDSAPIRAGKRATLKTATEQNLLVARGQGLIDQADGSREAMAMLAQIKADPVYSTTLDPRQFSAMLNLAERKVDREERKELSAVSNWKKARSAERTIEYINLQVRLAAGEDVSDEIDAFKAKYNAEEDPSAAAQWGVLARGEIARDAKHARLVGELEEDMSQLREVDAAFMGTGPSLDPYDNEVRKKVDFHYDGFSKQLEGLPEEEQTRLKVQYVVNTAVIPGEIKSWLRSANLSVADPERVVAAAEFLDLVDKSNPNVLGANQMDSASVSFLTQVREYHLAGIPAKEAVQMARDLRTVPKPVREDRRSIYQTHVKDGAPERYLKKQLSTGLFSSIDISPAAVAAFNRLVGEEHERTGDIEVSLASAFRNMNRRWGRTATMPGKEFGRNPAEKHYGQPNQTVEENAGWMLDQAKSDLLSGAVFPEGFDPVVYLVENPRQRAPDGRPAYTITYQDQDGRWRAAEDAWIPDYTQSERYKKEQTERGIERKRSLEAARAERNRDLGRPGQRVPNVFGGEGAEPNVFGNP